MLLGAQATSNKSVYPDNVASKINFELRNRSDTKIYIDIAPFRKVDYYIVYIIPDPDYTKLTPKNEIKLTNNNLIAINPDETFAAALGTLKTVNITIITPDYFKRFILSGTENYSIKSSGKTCFLSYQRSNKSGERLYPQKGPWEGLGNITPNFIMENRTITGLSKRNNVQAKDITLLKRVE